MSRSNRPRTQWFFSLSIIYVLVVELILIDGGLLGRLRLLFMIGLGFTYIVVFSLRKIEVDKLLSLALVSRDSKLSGLSTADDTE
jgi:hypothetical protein